MRTRVLAGLGVTAALLAATGCAPSGDEVAANWMARMDARPPEEQVPNWQHTRTMMMREAPQVGEPAPDFELEVLDGNGTLRLSSLVDARPVVLVFGSWT